jgi:hypothetical protein
MSVRSKWQAVRQNPKWAAGGAAVGTVGGAIGGAIVGTVTPFIIGTGEAAAVGAGAGAVSGGALAVGVKYNVDLVLRRLGFKKDEYQVD